MSRDLSEHINSNKSFTLKEIKRWCSTNSFEPSCKNIMTYIINKQLRELNQKYFIKQDSFDELSKQGMEDEYRQYMGYSLLKDMK